MQVQTNHIGSVTYPIQELDELEHVINASRRLLETLEQRRDRLLSELDHLTKPIQVQPPATTKWLSPRVEFKGECWRRFKIEPPCRLNFEPGLLANR